MALLNPPNMLTEAMRFLIRAVVASKERLSDSELIALVGAPGLKEAMSQIHAGDSDGADGAEANFKEGGKNIAKESFLALVQLGILEVNNGSVALGKHSDQAWRKVADVTTRSFIEKFEHAILTDHGRTVGADLLKAAAVIFTAENPLRAFDGFDETTTTTRSFVEHQKKELGTANKEEWGVGNTERWVSLRRMGSSLGWMAPLNVEGRAGLLPNAAPALQRWLPEVGPGLHGGEEFLRRAAERLPFLDGGSLSFRKIGSTSPLTGGLSLTLLNLQHRKLIELVDQADASKYWLSLGSDHKEIFSHVKVLPNSRKNRVRS